MMDIAYDIETYPNVFTIAFEACDAPFRWAFEISDWRNDSAALVKFIYELWRSGARLVGYNNIGFDYPVLHMLVRMRHATADVLYQKAMAIIGSQDEDRWAHQVYPNDRIVPQIDLYLIHHFDNRARATSLKALEFNMRSDNIEELPFPVGTVLTEEQASVVKRYNAHDVSETKRFYHITKPMIEFRESLVQRYPDVNWLDFNDTKIGKQYFIMQLEKAGVPCYEYGPNGRQPRQTPRKKINLRDVLLPWLYFNNRELSRVHLWLTDQIISETKGVFKDLTATVGNFTFVFGTGGIHGSVENRVIEADEDHVILDLDVSSYYPNLAIKQRFFPQHLGEAFCDIYEGLYEERMKHSGGTTENAMLKLALNGVFGDSNSRFSVFYDPLFTMRITLNGQMLLAMLADQLLRLEGLEMIQVNTDGLTVYAPKSALPRIESTTRWWQLLTKLTLEETRYQTMCVRDVNNYIAQNEAGKVKRKGAYEYNTEWHQNASALVVPKVAEKVLLEGAPIRATVESWPDPMDFMIRTRVPKNSHLALEKDEQQIQLPNTIRYYVAKGGGKLWKWMPPLKDKPDWRRFAVQAGWEVHICNDIKHAGELPIDFDWYVHEVEKLTLGVMGD